MKRPYSNVYFIKPVGLDGPIKIGYSTSPEKRLEELSLWSPIPLEIIGRVPGSLQDERFLHDCFADCHSHKEWFHPTPVLREMVAAILASGSIEIARTTLVSKSHVVNLRARSPELRKRATDSFHETIRKKRLFHLAGECS